MDSNTEEKVMYLDERERRAICREKPANLEVNRSDQTPGIMSGIMFVLLLLFVGYGQLQGQTKIQSFKVEGKLYLPTAEGEKLFQGSLTASKNEIVINCREKLFRPFNCFHIPRGNKLKVKTALVRNFHFQKDEFFIIPEKDFLDRYRNLFNAVSKGSLLSPKGEQAVIFILDEPKHIGSKELELIRAINHGKR